MGEAYPIIHMNSQKYVDYPTPGDWGCHFEHQNKPKLNWGCGADCEQWKTVRLSAKGFEPRTNSAIQLCLPDPLTDKPTDRPFHEVMD